MEFEGEETRLLLEHQTQGYFTNDMLVDQVHKAIDIFECKYSTDQGVFIFDNAPSHMKKPEDALNADKMNVKMVEKRPFMKDTTWNGTTQRMVQPDGVQKGMKTVLEERGVNTRDECR